MHILFTKMVEDRFEKPKLHLPKVAIEVFKVYENDQNSVNFMMHYFTLFLKNWIKQDFCDEFNFYYSKNDVYVLWQSIISHKKII